MRVLYDLLSVLYRGARKEVERGRGPRESAEKRFDDDDPYKLPRFIPRSV